LCMNLERVHWFVHHSWYIRRNVISKISLWNTYPMNIPTNNGHTFG
jgi:hypothetical protein